MIRFTHVLVAHQSSSLVNTMKKTKTKIISFLFFSFGRMSVYVFHYLGTHSDAKSDQWKTTPESLQKLAAVHKNIVRTQKKEKFSETFLRVTLILTNWLTGTYCYGQLRFAKGHQGTPKGNRYHRSQTSTKAKTLS